ncbi:hypothetical protein BDV96DRAFT_301997 [Lophiotrema nucula]|uniref:Uncharacterized protein n=1 Tax=Lophiotrema nucula TaxID=690887 RepID=A0A6A5YMM3_9PLEO|nr:hypothetical protein BDV96DRAFT_301997 [Lophiotrema nucula]
MPERKAYFLLPNTSIAPNTLIHLGQIIATPREPHRPLSPPLQPSPKTYQSAEFNYTFSKSTSSKTSISLVAQFLAQLGSPLSGNAGVELSKKKAAHWTFGKLETVYIEPDDAYITNSIQDPKVKAILEAGKLASNAVYMVTGMKIAYGASYARYTSSNMRTDSGLSVDATMLAGAPVSAGPEVAVQKSRDVIESCEGCTDFVWAVRLRRIRLTFLEKEVVHREVYGGQLSSVHSNMGELQVPSMIDSDEDLDEGKELEGAVLDEEDTGLAFIPRGCLSATVVDEDEEPCVAFYCT